GGVVRQVYDAAGRVVVARQYARRIPLADLPKVVSRAEVSALLDAHTLDRLTRYAYDADGRRVLEVDATGAVTRTAYDAAGNVVAVTAYATVASLSAVPAVPTRESLEALVVANGAADRTVRYAYDAAGRRVYEVSALGAVTASRYDAAGNVIARSRYGLAIPASKDTLAEIRDAVAAIGDERRDTFTYNAAGHLVATSDAAGFKETFTRDAAGRKLSFVNKEGATWTYTYDAAGRMVTEKTPPVALASVSVDAATGALVGKKDGTLALLTRFAYDAAGNLVQRTEAAGRPEERTTRYLYDALGRQVGVTYPDMDVYDATADDPTTTKLHKRTEETRTGLGTRTYYDALGNAIGATDIAGGVSKKVYDALGRVVYELDAMNYVTAYERNAFGEVERLVRYAESISLPAAVAKAGATATALQFNTALEARNHDNDRVLLSTYDRAGRLVTTTEPRVYVYEHSLTADGTGGYASKVTRQVWDAFDQVVQVVTSTGAGDGTATTAHYFDKDGRETGTLDAGRYLTSRSFDALGNLLSVDEHATAVGTAWSYGTKPGAASEDRRTEFVYDKLGRKTAEIRKQVEFSARSDGQSVVADLTTSYAYDKLGNQTSVRDATGITYTYYDAVGRVEAVVAPSRPDTDGKTAVLPLTVFHRDAHGKVVVSTEYAKGAASATVSAFTIDASGPDRKSLTLYDNFGRALQTTDA
ncbi:MAG: RHS repeat protein, partial [Comamonadaceae bacterium]